VTDQPEVGRQEHVIVMAPPRKMKSPWLPDVIARYPGALLVVCRD
jgi:hypothetical protein